MGKIRHKLIGLEEVEEAEKKKAEARRMAKKSKKTDKKKPEKKASENTQASEKKEKELDSEKKDESKEKSEKKQKKVLVMKRAKKGKSHERGKKYKKIMTKFDKKKTYPLDEVVKLVRSMKYTSFDETFEVHVNVKEQGIKGEVVLPHGTGKKLRVVVIDDKVIESIEKGDFDFDMLIAHPSMMPKLVKLAKVLGPKGLMPNPKNGTLTDNPEEAVKKFSAGTVRFKTEPKAAIIHQALGKMSFTDDQLLENLSAFLKAVGYQNILSAFVKSTMTPAVRIKLES